MWFWWVDKWSWSLNLLWLWWVNKRRWSFNLLWLWSSSSSLLFLLLLFKLNRLNGLLNDSSLSFLFLSLVFLSSLSLECLNFLLLSIDCLCGCNRLFLLRSWRSVNEWCWSDLIVILRILVCLDPIKSFLERIYWLQELKLCFTFLLDLVKSGGNCILWSSL